MKRDRDTTDFTFKTFKEFLADNCFDLSKYKEGKYDRKIYNWFRVGKPKKVEFYIKGKKISNPKQMKKKQLYNGQWTNLTNPKFLGCCDCGLVHRIDFRINKDGRMMFKVKTMDSLTKEARKKGTSFLFFKPLNK